jgi:hypothetical protein
VNFARLAAEEQRRLQTSGLPVIRPRIPSELNEAEAENEPEPGAEGEVNFPMSVPLPGGPIIPFVASPSPTGGYMGLDDIAMADSGYIIIPPDVAGGVGTHAGDGELQQQLPHPRQGDRRHHPHGGDGDVLESGRFGQDSARLSSPTRGRSTIGFRTAGSWRCRPRTPPASSCSGCRRPATRREHGSSIR